MTWLSGWKKRIKITVDHTKIDGDLSNFPVLLKVTSSGVFTELGANSKKIAVTASSGVTQNYVEIENWDNGNTVAWLWTKVPTVVSGIDTDIYLYYDNSKADNTDYVGDIGSASAKNVWDSNFVGVWHMCQDPSGGASCIKDSTSNVHHGTPNGSMTSGDLVDGKIGKALNFDGNDDRIEITDHNDFDFTTSFTGEVIAKILTDYNSGWHVLFAKGADSGNLRLWQIEIVIDGTKVAKGAIRKSSSDDVALVGDNFAWSVDTQYNFIITYDKSATELKLYKDGVQFGSTLSHDEDMVISALPINIGCGWYAGSNVDFINAVIDGVRFSNTARSAPWIKATYYSNWDTLLTYGNEEIRTYYFSGYVLEQNNPISRKLYLHDRATGDLIGTTTSSGDGYYYMETASSGSHYIVCLDDVAGIEYNDMIIGPALPTTMSG